MKLASMELSNLSVALVIALAIPLFLIWSLRSNSLVNLQGTGEHQWQQPVSILDKFPELISTDQWTFDYEATEQELLKLKRSQTGEIILNERAAEILSSALSKLPTNMHKDALQRMELLVTKGFPGKSGQQLARLLTDFYHYQQATAQASLHTNSPRTIKEQERRFQQTVLRQQRFFGEDDANKLFGRQHALNRYLHARRRINERSNLSPEQKQRQLRTLQDKFKAYEH